MDITRLLVSVVTGTWAVLSALWVPTSMPSPARPALASAVTELRYVGVPIEFYENIDKVTRADAKACLENGGLVLQHDETRKLFEAVQADRRTNVLTLPHFKPELKSPASFCAEGIAFEVAITPLGTRRIKGLIRGPAALGHKAPRPEISFNAEVTLREGETAVL